MLARQEAQGREAIRGQAFKRAQVMAGHWRRWQRGEGRNDIRLGREKEGNLVYWQGKGLEEKKKDVERQKDSGRQEGTFQDGQEDRKHVKMSVAHSFDRSVCTESVNVYVKKKSIRYMLPLNWEHGKKYFEAHHQKLRIQLQTRMHVQKV